jgi:hypothetical protein
MNTLHNKDKQATLIEHKERVQKSLSSNVLSKETIIALEELGEILRPIHARLISEGYEIVQGKICKNTILQKKKI